MAWLSLFVADPRPTEVVGDGDATEEEGSSSPWERVYLLKPVMMMTMIMMSMVIA